ncbi:MAG: carboxypeptidase regulatory-like domain-containing protein [Armatimonadetes bacterium]|nr:carboxypeptidase regulatory-like domain-containing protein [Armatimonadota bacterium]
MKPVSRVLFFLALVTGTPVGGASIRGVVSQPDARPLAGASVALLAGSAPPKVVTSGRRGDYEIAGVPPGAYVLVARKKGFRPRQVAARVEDAAGVVLLDLQLEAMALPPGSATCIVIGGDGQTPIVGARAELKQEVWSYPAGHLIPLPIPGFPSRQRSFQPRTTATSDGDGCFSFTDLPPGRYSLSLAAPGHGGQPDHVFRVPSGRVGVALTITLLSAGGIEGSVARPDGTPLAQAEVSYWSPLPWQVKVTTRSTRTGDDGCFRLPELTAGAYSLQIRAPDYTLGQIQNVSVRAGEKTTVPVFRMEPGITLHGRALRPDGSLAAGAVIQSVQNPPVTPAVAQVQEAAAGPDGTFELRGLEAGKAFIQATMEGLGPGEALVSLPEQADAPLDLPLWRLLTVRGTVRDPSGQPICGAGVSWKRTPPGFRLDLIGACLTNARGEYCLDRVSGATVTLRAGLSGYRETLVTRDLTGETGEITVDLTMVRGR